TADRLYRAFVLFIVPYGRVVAPLACRTNGQDDEIQDRPPFPSRLLDNPLVGEEFLEVAPHRPIARAVGRAEIEQEDTDASDLNRRVVSGKRDFLFAKRRRIRYFVHFSLSS